MITRIDKKLWAILLPLALGLAPVGAADRVVRVNPASITRGQSNSVVVVFDALGNENALGLSLCFETNQLIYLKAVRTAQATNISATLNLNVSQTFRGRLGLGLALPANTGFPVGSIPLLEVTFQAVTNGPSVATPVSLCDLPIGREVVDLTAGELGATYEDGVVNIIGICSYLLDTNAVAVAGAGGSGTVGLTAGSGCPWAVVKTNDWITMTSATSGSGNGTISFAVGANPGVSPRSGVLTVAGLSLTVNQAPFACSYSISPMNRFHGYGAATNSVTVNTDPGCPWSVVNTNNWITIRSGSSGTGDGSMTYEVQANPSVDLRTATFTVAGQDYNILQAGLICAYKISPTNRTHGASLATNTVSVTAGDGCAWSVNNTNSWVTILSGAGGNGNGTVTYLVEANPNPTPRIGGIGIAGDVLVLTQQAVVCSYKLSPTNRSHGYTAATNSVTLTTSGGCPWTISNPNNWITITSASSGLGNATVTYTLTTNPGTTTRTGLVTVADQAFTVTQSAGELCSYKISPTTRTHGSSLATNTVSVTASNGCAWTVENTNAWVTVLSGASGDGNGTVTYAVDANPNPVARIGSVLIADQFLTLTQQAVTCSYKLSPTNRSHGVSAATNTLSLTTSSGCSWTVVNSNSWITITSASSGLGNATVGYTITANAGSKGRTGIVSVADQLFTLTQAGLSSCGYKISPTGRSHGTSAATNTVSVTASNGCAWTVENTNAWISILSGASGEGTGTVTYAVEANPNPVTRIGSLVIAEQSLTLTQQAVTCSYKLSTTNRTHGYTAATNSVTMMTSGGCPWTVSNNNSWITILGGSGSGTGTGIVNYAVAANETFLERTGVVDVAGQLLVLVQHAAPCSYSISPTNRIHGYSPATNSVTLTAASGCPWTVVNTNDWITITSPLSGTGNATVSYTIGDNPALLQRTGYVVIADQVLSLSQRATPCLFEVSPTNRVHGKGSEIATLDILTTATCPWTAVITNSWIRFLVGGAGIGPNELTYVVDPNPDTAPRLGYIFVGDAQFVISQLGSGCTFTVTPTNRVHGGGSETGQVSVTTMAGCPWSIVNPYDWIHLNYSGLGSALLNYSIDANPSLSPRTGQLVIAGQPFTVTQMGFTCAYKLSATNRVHGNGSVTGLVSVTTSNGCTWTVVNTNDWVTITTDINGNGSGGVGYLVAANLMISDRTGTLLIAGQSFVLTQRGAPCSLTLSPDNRNHGYGLATGSVTVTTLAGCPWSVDNTNDWISILTGASGSGTGSFTYVVSENPVLTSRTGLVMVADQVLTVVQGGAPCTYSLSTSSRTHGYAAATNSVGLTTMAGCSWTVVNSNSWITITSATSGSGNATIAYVVATNPETVDRVGSVSIADKTFTVTQRAAPCPFNLSPTNQLHGYLAGTGLVTVTTTTNCSWTVVNTNSWITIDSGATGSVHGTFGYSVSANPSPTPRVGVLEIGDSRFTVNQAGVPCDSSIVPLSRNHGSGSETGQVSVVISNTCPWNVINTNQWVTIVSGASGSGNGVVTYTIAANPAMTSRQAGLTIAGQLFSITQEAAGCTYKLSPTNRIHGHGAATGTVSVAAMTGCTWTVQNTNDWITLLGGTSGSGTGLVTYAVSDNPVIVGRTGVVVIANESFVVSQQAAPCTYSLSPTRRTHGFGATNNTIALTTLAGCAWTVVNTNDWINITSSLSGVGNATISYTVLSNLVTIERTGLVMIAEEVFTLTQRAAPCLFALTPTNGLHGSGTETGLITVATSDNCSWQAQTTNDWITITAGNNGLGNGHVGYALAANPTGVQREGAVSIEGTVYPVSQAGAPCTYDIAPTSRVHGAGAQTGVVTVITLDGCSWSIVNLNDWITILSSTNGPGERSVTYSVNSNSGVSQRSGEITIAGRTFTVVQVGIACSYSLSSTQHLHGALAETGTVGVTTSSGCPWPVVNTNGWITLLSGTSGTNNGTVTYSVTANPDAALRSGTILIGGVAFVVSQSAAACVYAISPTNRVHAATASTGTVSVVSPGGCPWTASSTNSWISILTGSSGSGTGTVSYAVQGNPTSIPRSGTLQIAGTNFTVGQAGSTCVSTIAPTNMSFGAGSGTGLVTVTSLPGCSWESVSDAGWITITSGLTGTGNGTVGYSVAANPTLVIRTGVLTVAGQSLTVTQAAAVCSFVISPTNLVHGAGLGTGTVAVTTISGCNWGVTNTNNWITIVSGATGVGNGNVTYTIGTNPTATARSGQLTIAGQLFTVSQAGTTCHFALVPTSRSHTAALETGTVTVASIAGCAWNAGTTTGWITILPGASGNGGGSLSYSVAANPDIVSRSGTITVADQVFSVTQAGIPCTITLSPPAWIHRSGSETGIIGVTTFSGCTWTVSNTNSWVTLTTPSTNGSGPGNIGYTVAANAGTSARAGVITVGGQPFSVSQLGSACTFKISPTNRLHGFGAVTNSVAVTTTNGCSWTVVNTNDWVTILSGSSGSGTGVVSYAVTKNTNPNLRLGLVNIAGEWLTLTQWGTNCGFLLAPTSRSHTYASETGLVAVTTSSTNCVWNVSNPNSWITINTGASGTNSGSIGYTVATNASSSPRTGSFTAGGEVFTVTQSGAPCVYAVLPASRSHGAGLETGLVNIAVVSGCSWSVGNSNSWITLTPGAAGNGAGSFGYSVAANPTALLRTALLIVADQVFTITQTGAACTYTIAPTSVSFGGGSGTGLVTVTALVGCSWTVTNNNSWIIINSGASGVGNGTIGYSVTANPAGTPRTGVLSVGTQVLTVTQAGADCLFTLLPTSRAHGSGAESSSISVTTLSGCVWTVDNTNSWIQITSGNGGTGSGTVGYGVLSNPSINSRTGYLTIGGQAFQVTQAGFTCAYSLAPSSRSHGIGLETGSFSVTTSNACTWTAATTNTWISITAPTNGTGNGTVNYSVIANTGATRVGIITVGGQTFTVTQNGMLRMIRSVDMSISRGQTNVMLVVLESKGDENALGFSLGFDTNLLTFLKAVRGVDGTNASAQLNVNTNQIASAGRIGFGLGLPAGVPFPSGNQTVLEVYFRAAAGTTFATTSVTNSDKPILREVVDVNAEELTTSYKDAVVSILGDCAYALSASSASIGDTGGSGSVSVTANSACAWTVSNLNSWITITPPTNGLGNGTVNFGVAANVSPTPRSGVLTIAGKTFTVNQSGINCTYALTPAGLNHGAGAETGLVAVAVATGCPWTVNNTNNWISITTPTNGSGNGTFGYSIQANPTLVARTGLVQVATQVYTLSQAAAVCSYSLAPASRAHAYGVETGQVVVTALTGCAWTTSNTNSWIVINSGANGNGNGSVGYTVGINPSLNSRTGVVVIAGQSFQVTQAGNVCAYAIAPSGRTHTYSSESNTVAVISSNTCPWTVANTNSWITINSGASGSGNGSVTYTVSFNASGSARSGVLVIGGQSFTVTQPGSPCAYAIAPSERSHGAGIESASISLATFGGCAWTAVTTNTWITITSGASGVGSGSINYTLAGNPGGPTRTGLVVIPDTDLSFKITQAGQPCTFSLSTSNKSYTYLGDTGSVALTAVAGCPWNVVNSNSWITITSGLSGGSSTNVAYTVAANPTSLNRTGVVTIADIALTVLQTGAPCTYALSPTNRVHGSGAITSTVSVITLVGCGWSANSPSSWITILSGASGNGTGTVTYSISENMNAASRTGAVNVAGQSLTLVQSGGTCVYDVSPTNRVHGQGLVFGQLIVKTLTGCPWTVSNSNSWITILSLTNMTGSNVVDYQVSPNLNAFMRTGIVMVAGQPVTLIQSETPCSFTLLPTARTHTGSSETGTISVATVNGCAWNVNNPNSWITITSGASGSSNGVVTYVVAGNPTTILRSGVLTIAGQTFTVTQEGLPCRYQLSPAFSLVTSGNVTGLVGVTTSNGCAWITENTNAWIAIKSGESGTGPGLVKFTAAPNPNPSSRTGNLVIGGEIHPITQAGAPCSYQLSATNRTLGSGSETGMVSVFTSFECVWTTINTNPWITITSGTNGSGNASIGYSLLPNPTAGDRTGFLTIAGINSSVTYQITQFGSSCSYAVTPQGRLHGPGLETGMVSVSSVTGCTWTVTKTNTWITINSGAIGTNDGFFTYTLAVNASPTQRSGVLVVGGVGGAGAKSYIVTQDGVLCTYAISPTNGVHGFAAGTGVVSVATSNVCPWTVSNTNSWIILASPTNNTGNTNLTYTLTFNPSPSPRTGYLTIAGQPYPVTQNGITCLYSLTPTSRSHDFNAGTGVVAVATSNLCTWAVNNTNTWITITPPAFHTNSGTMGYALSVNPAVAPRVGIIDIAGQPFTVTQFGVPFAPPTNKTVDCSTFWSFNPPTVTGTCTNLNTTLIILSTVTNVVCGTSLNATRTWDATDGCGNHLVLTQMVKVVISSPPLLFCGTNKTVECGVNWNFDTPTAVDGCGGTNISVKVLSTVTNKVGACGNTLVAIRTWEGSDACSNKATCIQVVSVVDRTAPVVVCGANRLVECGSSWSFTNPTASDGCGTNVMVNVVSTTTNNVGFCGATFIATRIWEALDSCSNRATCSQTVTVVDTTPPALTCGAAKLVECGQSWSFDAPSATDNCGSAVSIVTLSTVTNTADFCGSTYSVTRTWEATDSCSNKSTCAQTVRLVDTTLPVLVCRPNKVVEFGLTWGFDLPTVTDGCTGTGATIRVVATVTNSVGFCGITYSATRFWEASDACSNRSALCSQTVRIADTTAPFLICPTNKTVRCNQPWTFDAPSAYDLASGSNVFINVVSTVTNGACGSGQVITRTWEAVDGCTNKSTCTQVVTGISEISIAGTVSYATNYPMTTSSDKRLGTVAMRLTGDTNMTVQTDSSGAYRFTLNPGGSCVLLPTLTNSVPVANGVSTLDISLIRRHILNIAQLDSPYKLLAADVNGSKTVSSLDLPFIRRMILTPTNTLPSGLWRFVPMNYVFPNWQSPWDAPTNRIYTGLSADLVAQDFVAIKMGDVNNSWNPPVVGSEFGPAAARAAVLSGPDVFFQVSRHTNQPGETVTTKVTARGLRDLTSAQWTLSWDPAVLRFKSTADYGLKGLAAGNFGTDLLASGKLTFSWDDPDSLGVTEADGTTLFSASFEVVGAPGTSSPVALADTATEREVAVKFAPASMRTQDGQVFVAAAAPSDSPQLKQPLYLKGTFGVPLATVSGKVYILEYTDALPSTNWIALPPVTGDGTVKTLSDPSPQTKQRFYRVRIE